VKSRGQHSLVWEETNHSSETSYFFGGVDVGSCTTKAVLVAVNGKILAASVAYSGTDFEAAAQTVWTKCLEEAHVDPL